MKRNSSFAIIIIISIFTGAFIDRLLIFQEYIKVRPFGTHGQFVYLPKSDALQFSSVVLLTEVFRLVDSGDIDRSKSLLQVLIDSGLSQTMAIHEFWDQLDDSQKASMKRNIQAVNEHLEIFPRSSQSSEFVSQHLNELDEFVKEFISKQHAIIHDQ
jgi:hypothetical protein